MVSYCDRWMSVVRRVSSTIDSKRRQSEQVCATVGLGTCKLRYPRKKDTATNQTLAHYAYLSRGMGFSTMWYV